MGFWTTVKDSSRARPGIYTNFYTTGLGGESWSGLFGGDAIPDGALEWTWNNEVYPPQAFSYPKGWRMTGASAYFSPGSSTCDAVWQWTGGSDNESPNDISLDQFNQAAFDSGRCV
jgi:hypothetical protein